MTTQPETTIALTPPRLLSAQTLLTVAGLTAGLLASFLSTPRQEPLRVALEVWLAAVVFVVGYLAVLMASIRRAGAMPPIILTPAELVLPKHALSAKPVRVPIERVRSVCIVGRSFYARLVIDTGRRFFVFPRARLVDPDAVIRAQAALAAYLRARPDGAALAEAAERRHRMSSVLGPIMPIGSWAMVAVIIAVFCLEQLVITPENPFALLDMGANASALVGQGQWFRLITASLLHLSARHLFGNALSLLVIGGMVERLVGFRHFVILLLSACIVSQIVSAAAGALPNGHVFSVGLSGGIFGLLGALGAITWRFGNALPAGLRLPGWRWAVLVVLYAICFPLLVPQVDSWAHGGGAVAGFLVGGLLCLACPDAPSLRRPVWLTGEALAAVLLIFAVGIGAAAIHALTPAAHFGDELVIAQTIVHRRHADPALRNALAWQVATEPGAPPPLLHVARALSVQATGQLRKRPWNDPLLTAATDTQAVLDYRLGDPLRAMWLQADLPWSRAEIGSHLALFLDAVLRDHGPQVRGDDGPPPPNLQLDHGVMRLTQSAPAPNGARLYALLRGRDGLAGVLFFRVPAGFSGTQVLPLPVTQSAPSPSAPPPIWTDTATTLQVALFDRRGCYCDWPGMAPDFAPYTPDPDIAP